MCDVKTSAALQAQHINAQRTWLQCLISGGEGSAGDGSSSALSIKAEFSFCHREDCMKSAWMRICFFFS
eukprot:8833753-Prorocentrum_lima.AAC.1